MSEWLSGLLRGDHNIPILLILKVLFFTALFAALRLLCSTPPPQKKVKVSYTLLCWIFCCSLVAIFIYQATWQLGGMARPEFVKFMRTYNRRKSVAGQQVLRGAILDQRGMVLAAPKSGSIWKRRYPLGAAAVHPLGYYNPRYGITAVERVCDGVLSGIIQDKQSMAKSILGRRAEQGENITLTLDSRLQRKAYQLLNKRRGAVVIMDPRTGALLALVSSPGFDPAQPQLAMGDTRGKPLFNRAVQGRYPPGSTFKIVTAGAALNQEISPTYNCPPGGYIAGFGRKAIRDSEYYSARRKGRKWRGWGRINLKEAMIHSSNVYFAQLGADCSADLLKQVMQSIQLDSAIVYMAGSSGDLACAAGTLPGLKSKWHRAQSAIGQGDVLATPLHVACYTAAAANQGSLCAPKLNAETPTEKLAQPFTRSSAYILKVMLRDVVKHGTGRQADLQGLDVCGKTGTAQISSGKDHAWFTCFAPFTKPEIVVTVLIENGGYGAATALPVAKSLLLEADRLGLIKGSKRSRK